MKRYNAKIYVHGKPKPGFLVPNHTSYLDPILVLALKAGGAVAKKEIKDYKRNNFFKFAGFSVCAGACASVLIVFAAMSGSLGPLWPG